MRKLLKLTMIGVVAGSIFGLFLKAIDQVAKKQVYTLLLNVDYFPILKNLQMSEQVEFSLHLLVSVFLVIILYVGLHRFRVHMKISYYVVINVLLGMVLFLTTTLSERTPEVSDLSAFIYWIAGHLIFGTVIGVMILFLSRRRAN